MGEKLRTRGHVDENVHPVGGNGRSSLCVSCSLGRGEEEEEDRNAGFFGIGFQSLAFESMCNVVCLFVCEAEEGYQEGRAGWLVVICFRLDKD